MNLVLSFGLWRSECNLMNFIVTVICRHWWDGCVGWEWEWEGRESHLRSCSLQRGEAAAVVRRSNGGRRRRRRRRRSRRSGCVTQRFEAGG